MALDKQKMTGLGLYSRVHVRMSVLRLVPPIPRTLTLVCTQLAVEVTLPVWFFDCKIALSYELGHDEDGQQLVI